MRKEKMEAVEIEMIINKLMMENGWTTGDRYGRSWTWGISESKGNAWRKGKDA